MRTDTSRDLQFRLAFRDFRDFGSCLGIGCISDIRDDVADLNSRSREIITQWQKYLPSSLTPGDRSQIARVMCASALIPGDE
jgi:hypothetical protein